TSTWTGGRSRAAASFASPARSAPIALFTHTGTWFRPSAKAERARESQVYAELPRTAPIIPRHERLARRGVGVEEPPRSLDHAGPVQAGGKPGTVVEE